MLCKICVSNVVEVTTLSLNLIKDKGIECFARDNTKVLVKIAKVVLLNLAAALVYYSRESLTVSSYFLLLNAVLDLITIYSCVY